MKLQFSAMSDNTRQEPGHNTNLSQPVQSISQRRIGEVPFCELRYQLLKLGFKQLRVRRLLGVRPIASTVSLERRFAKQQRCVFELTRGDGEPHFRGINDQAAKTSHSQPAVEVS